MEVDEIVTQKDYLEYARAVHEYSPAIVKLLNLAESYIPDAEQKFKDGRKNAIWSSGGWEAPLVYSLDTIPIAFGELGRLSDKDTMNISEDYYQFPVETCSMVKCVVGQWHIRKGENSIKKILGGSSGCEPYNLAWEVMKKHGYDVHNTDIIYRAANPSFAHLDTWNILLSNTLAKSA